MYTLTPSVSWNAKLFNGVADVSESNDRTGGGFLFWRDVVVIQTAWSTFVISIILTMWLDAVQ